jgi:hypothetical protein
MICVNFDAGYGCFTPEAKKSPVKIVVVGMPLCPTYNIFLSYLASRILYRTSQGIICNTGIYLFLDLCRYLCFPWGVVSTFRSCKEK